MNRGITLFGASLLLSSGVLAAQTTSRQAAAKPAANQAPKFEVDPMWPKPLANRWILGSSTGVAVDARDHVYMVHMTDTFTPRTEIGLATNPPTGECCAPAPNVLEYDAAGNLVNHWGGPGAGYDWPAQNTGLAVDDSGNVWIGGAGGQDSRILKFSRDGKFIAQFGKAPAVAAAAPPAGGAGRGPDTAYAGVSPGRGAAGRGAAGGRGGRGGRGGGPPPLPANSTSMDSFGGAGGLLVRHKGQRSLRRRRRPQSSRGRDRHDDGRDQALLGRVRQAAERRRLGEVRARRPGAEAVRQPGALRQALERRPRLRVRHAERSHPGVQEGRIVREGESHRTEHSRRRFRVGRRVLARPEAAIPLRRRRLEHEGPHPRP